MIQIDDFLGDGLYEELKVYSLSEKCRFEDIENPVDQVKYPFICTDIPKDIKERIWSQLCEIFDKEVTINAIFMRRSPEGVSCPHIIHNDLSMGLNSLMLYMNDHEDGGTGIVRHLASGMMYQPENHDFVEVAVFDQNSPEKWSLFHKFNMKQNSAAIFDAALFHCALPIGGFGENEEARTVLTVFFS